MMAVRRELHRVCGHAPPQALDLVGLVQRAPGARAPAPAAMRAARRSSRTPAGILFLAPLPAAHRLGDVAVLRGDRLDRRPWRRTVRRRAPEPARPPGPERPANGMMSRCHGSVLSRFEASGEPGAVQLSGRRRRPRSENKGRMSAAAATIEPSPLVSWRRRRSAV